MEIKKLYRYEREAGKVTVSTEKPDGDYTEVYRLIADKGKVLTDGVATYACIDTDSPNKFTEIDEPTTDIDINDEYAEAGRILLGVSE